ATAGNYRLSFGIASPGSGAFDVAIDGTRAAQYSITPSYSWTTFNTTAQQTVYLSAGTHTLRIAPTNGSQFNIDAITLVPTTGTTPATPTTPTSTSSSNTITVGSSATITADKYTDISNSKLEYINGVADIGYLSSSGGYVEYTLNVQTAGN